MEKQERLTTANFQILELCQQYISGLLGAVDILEAMDKIHLPCVNGLLDENTGLRYPD